MEKNNNLISISSKSGGGKDTVAKLIQYWEIDNRFKNITDTNWTLDQFIRLNLPLSQSLYQIHRFADKLKQIVSLLTGIPREDLEKEEIKSSFLPQEWNTFNIQKDFIGTYHEFKQQIVDNPNCQPFDLVGLSTKTPYIMRWTYVELIHRMTIRECLQVVGTQCLRNNLHPSAHLNAFFSEYKSTTIGFTPTYNDPDNKGFNLESESIYPCWIIPDLRFKNEFQAIKDRGGLTIRIDRDYDKTNPKFNHQSETDLDDYRDKFDYILDNNGSIEDLAKQVKIVLQLEKII